MAFSTSEEARMVPLPPSSGFPGRFVGLHLSNRAGSLSISEAWQGGGSVVLSGRNSLTRSIWTGAPVGVSCKW